MDVNAVTAIGVVIIIATIIGYIAKLLKQPLIPAYVLTGLVLGPIGHHFGIDHFFNSANVALQMSEIGVTFLLFVVGLELNIEKLKNIGSIATFGGVIQVLALSSIGFLFAFFMGFLYIEAMYLGLVLAFSSTMVVVKELADKRELDTLHGKIIIGFLLMQDVFAIIALTVFGSLNDFSFAALGVKLFSGVAMVIFALMLGKYAFPRLFKFAAKSPELLFLLSLTVCFSFSIAFELIHFSMAIGAFIGGLSLASLPYNVEIIGKIYSLRDFFATLFFVSLGITFTYSGVSMLKPLLIFFLLIVVVKTIVNFALVTFFKYKRKSSFFAAISLSQVSEFSLILVAQGFFLGHVTAEMVSLVTFLAVLTITLTSYFMKYDKTLYTFLNKYLVMFDSSTGDEELLQYNADKPKDAVLVGNHRIGYSVHKKLMELGKNIIVVDYNPDRIRHLMDEKIPCLYGDISDPEILHRLNVENLKLIISTLDDLDDNKIMIDFVRQRNPRCSIFAAASDVDDALELYEEGADYVILPHFLGGEHTSLLLEEAENNVDTVLNAKVNHIKELLHRKNIGHSHPKHQRHN